MCFCIRFFYDHRRRLSSRCEQEDAKGFASLCRCISFWPAFVLGMCVLFGFSASGAATTTADDLPADVRNKIIKDLRPDAGVSSY
jgi:hypothetical protein